MSPTLREYEDHKERYLAAIARYKLGEISEANFRMLLAALGYNATDIEAEIRLVDEEKE